MKSLNRVTLLGCLGKDPVTKEIGSTKKSYFSIATTEHGKDGKEYTDWHTIIAWGAVCDVVDKYLKKGSWVLIEGPLRQRSYEKDGAKTYVTEVELRSLHMLGGSGAGSGKTVTSEDNASGTEIQNISEDLPF